jgi:hypothetical protein
VDPYVLTYNTMMTARANGVRSQSLTADKDTRKASMLQVGRELYSLVSANSNVSDADKISLGIHIRSTPPSPIPAPSVRPGVDLVSVVGRTITVSVHDTTTSNKRGKPAGAVSAWVYSYVGTDYPTDPTEWNFHGAYNKAEAVIDLAGSVPAGAQVWICAAWVNRKGDAGPTSVPLTTNVQGGGTSSASMKIAA